MTSTAVEQRQHALDRANQIRHDRADLKRRLATGECEAAEVILHPPAEARSWPVAHLLIAQRSWGVTRVRRLLAGTLISETRPVGMLTDRQRHVLVGALGHGEER